MKKTILAYALISTGFLTSATLAHAEAYNPDSDAQVFMLAVIMVIYG